MTTRIAFAKFLESGKCTNKAHERTWRLRLKQNRITLEKMEEVLLKHGAKKKNEIWKL